MMPAIVYVCVVMVDHTVCSGWQCFVWFKSFAATRWFSCNEAVGLSLATGRGEELVVCIGPALSCVWLSLCVCVCVCVCVY